MGRLSSVSNVNNTTSITNASPDSPDQTDNTASDNDKTREASPTSTHSKSCHFPNKNQGTTEAASRMNKDELLLQKQKKRMNDLEASFTRKLKHGVPATYHPHNGLPIRVNFWVIDDDHSELVVTSTTHPRSFRRGHKRSRAVVADKYTTAVWAKDLEGSNRRHTNTSSRDESSADDMPTNTFGRVIVRIQMSLVKGIVLGCNTTNFMRSRKFDVSRDRSDRDEHCFSLVTTNREGYNSNNRTNTNNNDGEYNNYSNNSNNNNNNSRSNGNGKGNDKNNDNNNNNTQDTFDFEIEPGTHTSAYAARTHVSQGFSLVFGTPIVEDPTPAPPPSGFVSLFARLTGGTPMQTIVFTAVFLSVVSMALASPLMQVDPVLYAQFRHQIEMLDTFDTAVSILFTVEMVVKLIALEGVRGYVKDRFNAFDGFLVILGLASEIATMASQSTVLTQTSLIGNETLIETYVQDETADVVPNLSGLRALRAFRILRTVKYFTGMRQVVETMIATMGMVVQGLLVYLQSLVIFAVLGQYLYGDALSYMCISTIQGFTSLDISQLSAESFSPYCDPLLTGQEHCPLGYECLRVIIEGRRAGEKELPSWYTTSAQGQFTGFQTFQSAMLTVYRMSTGAGSGREMRGLIKTKSPFSVLYVLGVVFVISFMVFALFIAIIRQTFAKVKADDSKRKPPKQISRKSVEMFGRARRMLFLTNNQERRLSLRVSESNLVQSETSGEHSKKIRTATAQDSNSKVDNAVESFKGLSKKNITAKTHSNIKQDVVVRSKRKRAAAERKICGRMTTENDLEHNPPTGLVSKFCHTIISNVWYERIITLCIVTNCVTLAMKRYDQSEATEQVLAYFESSFTLIFTAEVVLNLIGLQGFRNYLVLHKNKYWNCFDVFLVVSSLIDAAMSLILGNGAVNLSLFRVFRLLRAVRVLRQQSDIVRLVVALLGSIPSIVNLLALALVIVGIYALIGMQLYGTQVGYTGDLTTDAWNSSLYDPPRLNFDTFSDSMSTLFVCMTGGAMWIVYFNFITSDAKATVTLFFLSYSIFTTYMVVNFMVVVIMSNFKLSKEQLEEQRQQRAAAILKSLPSMERHKDDDDIVIKTLGQRRSVLLEMNESFRQLKRGTSGTRGESFDKPALVQTMLPRKRSSMNASRRAIRERKKAFETEKYPDPELTNSADRVKVVNEDDRVHVIPSRTSTSSDSPSNLMKNNSNENKSFRTKRQTISSQIYAKKQRIVSIRKFAQRITRSHYFEWTIILCILGSSVSLTFESPKYLDNTSLQNTLALLDEIFLAVFCLEFLMKVCATGFFSSSSSSSSSSSPAQATKRLGSFKSSSFKTDVETLDSKRQDGVAVAGYWADPWNRLDLFVLVVTLVSSLVGQADAGQIGRAFRMGRILRPLRMINKNKGMKVIVDALLRAIRPVSYTVLLLLWFFFTFAVLGIEFFMGTFWSCNDDSVDTESQCFGEYQGVNSTGHTIILERVWSNPWYSFDSISAALATLFEVIALKGWQEKLYTAWDARGIGLQPRRDSNSGATIYFVVFIFFGSFFMMKLFVGVIVTTFRQFSGNALLTPAQLHWLETKRAMARIKPNPKPPDHPMKRKLFTLVQHPWFDKFATLVLYTNVFVLAVVHDTTRATDTSHMLDDHNSWYWTFASFYVCEIGLKMVPCGPQWFIKHSFWNGLDSFLVFVIVGTPVVAGGMHMHVAVLLRATNVMRVVNLVSVFKGLDKLFTVLGMCVIPFLNVSCIFGMLLFLFAVIGMQLFAHVKPGDVLGAEMSFYTFEESLLTLFQIVSGDNWIPLMRDCSVEAPNCEEGVNCGSYKLAVTYFFTFYLLVFGVFVNLYTATIIDSYSSLGQSLSTNTWNIGQADFDHFRSTWDNFDPNGVGWIAVRHLKSFLVRLGPPLIPDPNEPQGAQKVMEVRLEIMEKLGTKGPCANGGNGEIIRNSANFGFFSTLQVIVLHRLPISHLDMEERIRRLQKARAIQRELAAMRIQACFRGRMFRDIISLIMTIQSQCAKQGVRLHDMNEEQIENVLQRSYNIVKGRKKGGMTERNGGEGVRQDAMLNLARAHLNVARSASKMRGSISGKMVGSMSIIR